MALLGTWHTLDDGIFASPRRWCCGPNVLSEELMLLAYRELLPVSKKGEDLCNRNMGSR